MSHFRFLDLPRELRDVIYDLSIIPEAYTSLGVDEYDTMTRTTHIPTPALLQVNKQIRTEYSDQLPATRTLIVQGGHCDYWTGYPDIDLSLARSITECVVYIHVQCYCDNMSEAEREEFEDTGNECDAVDFLHNYREALQPFLSQFQNLQSVHIRLGLWGSDELDPAEMNHSQGFAEALDMLVVLPLEIRDLEIVRCTGEEDYERYRCGDGHELPKYFTWTRRDGWEKGDLLAENE